MRRGPALRSVRKWQKALSIERLERALLRRQARVVFAGVAEPRIGYDVEFEMFEAVSLSAPGVLPAKVRAWASALAAVANVSFEFALLTLLSAMSAAVSGSKQVRRPDGGIEALSLIVFGVAPPAYGKTRLFTRAYAAHLAEDADRLLRYMAACEEVDGDEEESKGARHRHARSPRLRSVLLQDVSRYGLVEELQGVGESVAMATQGTPVPQDPFRQAIVIGVWRYANEPGAGLGDMKVDLKSLATTFRELHFDTVNRLENPTQAEMEQAIIGAAHAALSAERSGRATLTVVYFAGHGTMVANASYLLGSDFVRSADASDLVLQGGIRTDYVGETFSKLGQPSLLIVEACRNPFTPNPAAPAPAPSSADSGEFVPPPPSVMISGPDRFSGYAAFFGQEPGQLVEIDRIDPTKPTPLVAAFAKTAPLTGAAVPLFAEVRRRVISETESQSHPLRPEYLDRGAGDLRLYYDDADRDADRRQWEKAERIGDPELVKAFLAGFRTSRYAAVTRYWLDNYEPKKSDSQYAVYTPDVRLMLGGVKPAGFESVPTTKPIKLSNRLVTAMDGMKWSLIDFEVLRRVEASDDTSVSFEARAFDGKSIAIRGQASAADPSKVPDFWSGDGVTSISCVADQIEKGECEAVELLAAFAKQASPKKIGTLFIATIFNPVGSGDSVALAYDRTVALAARLQALGLSKESIGFRTFFGFEVPTAHDSLLIKRGDSKPLSMEIQNAAQ